MMMTLLFWRLLDSYELSLASNNFSKSNLQMQILILILCNTILFLGYFWIKCLVSSFSFKMFSFKFQEFKEYPFKVTTYRKTDKKLCGFMVSGAHSVFLKFEVTLFFRKNFNF